MVHHSLILSPMRREDSEESASLVGRAMNRQEEQYARTTFERHFAVRDVGMHGGRHYFVARDREGLVGFTGLHHWAWGPEENVWLGWFAVEPGSQGTGVGTWLLAATEQKARELGFKKLFVETYDHPDFNRAMAFYLAKGFKRVGGIEGWLPGGEAMVVLMKELLASVRRGC